jgi:hypothetical protein
VSLCEGRRSPSPRHFDLCFIFDRGSSWSGVSCVDNEQVWQSFKVDSPSTLLVQADPDSPAHVYDGANELDKMMAFVAKHTGIDVKGKSAAAPPPKPAQPLVLHHVVSQEQLFKHCLNKNSGMCVLTWIPSADLADTSGPKGSNKYLHVLQTLTTKVQGVHLVYLDASVQTSFVQVLGGSGSEG